MLWLKTRFPSNIDFISNNKLISTFGAWNTRDKRQTHWLSVLRTSNTQYSVCFPDCATNRMLMFIMSVTYIHVVWQTHFLVGFDDKTHPRTNTLAHKMCVFSTSKTVYCTRMNVHTIIDERWFSGIVKWFSDCINALRCLVVLIISVYKLLRLVDFKVEQSRSAVIDLSLSLSECYTHSHTDVISTYVLSFTALNCFRLFYFYRSHLYKQWRNTLYKILYALNFRFQ